MTNFKVEKTDEGTLVTQGNMTKTTAENIKKDFEKTKDMSAKDSADYALKKLEEENAAKKRYDDMTNFWIKNNKTMSREEKDKFLKEYMMLREKYSFSEGGVSMKHEMKKLKLDSGALVTTTPQQVMSAEDQVGVVRSNVESAQNLSDAEILAILDISSQMIGSNMLKLVTKAEGGYIGNKFAEGGLQEEGGETDPVSGNKVPIGSTKEEVRDDIPAMLSEGEFVFPADVVRFIGLEKLMKMRQAAKEGLKKMEAMGQMGNSEEAILPDDIPFNVDDLEMEDDDENVQGFSQGGGYMYNPSGEPAGVYNPSRGADLLGESATGAPKTFNKRYVNPETGEVRFIPFLGEPPEGSGPLYPIDDLLNAGFVHQPVAKETKVESDEPTDTKEDKEDTSVMVGSKQVREMGTISQADIDNLNITEEKNFLGMPYLKNAPKGWNSQKQREFNLMKEEGLSPIAMWTGSDWQIYSQKLDGTEFGTPGRISKDNMFKSKYKGQGFGLKSIINTLTGEVDLDKIYEQNLATAMQNKNIQPKKIKEKYGDRGFTDKTIGEDPARDTDESAEVTNINKAATIIANPNNFSASEVDAANELITKQTSDDKKPAVGEGSLEAAMKAAEAKKQEQLRLEEEARLKAEAEDKAKADAEARRKAEAEQAAQQAAADAYMKQLADQKAKADRAAAERREQQKKDRESRIQAGQSMQGRPRMAISRPDLEDRPASEQGGAGVTTNLRSFEKGGLLMKKPKKNKVMKRGGLASKK